MRILLTILSILIFLSFGCKRPDRTLKGQPEVESKFSDRDKNRVETRTSHPTTEIKPERRNQITEVKSLPNNSKNLSDLFQVLQQEVFMIYTINGYEEVSQGSGFFIAPGVGITNYHVLEDSENAVIAINEEVYEIIDVLDSSYANDMDYVIFRTNYRTQTPLKIADKKPRIGEDIFAIGSPKGLSNSLTKGTISGFRENDRIQIDATIDHGSSGGPLFNLKGEVIGITTSGMGTGSELNFAVNIQALPYGKYVR
jgi:serine protease Do